MGDVFEIRVRTVHDDDPRERGKMTNVFVDLAEKRYEVWYGSVGLTAGAAGALRAEEVAFMLRMEAPEAEMPPTARGDMYYALRDMSHADYAAWEALPSTDPALARSWADYGGSPVFLELTRRQQVVAAFAYHLGGMRRHVGVPLDDPVVLAGLTPAQRDPANRMRFAEPWMQAAYDAMCGEGMHFLSVAAARRVAC